MPRLREAMPDRGKGNATRFKQSSAASSLPVNFKDTRVVPQPNNINTFSKATQGASISLLVGSGCLHFLGGWQLGCTLDPRNFWWRVMSDDERMISGLGMGAKVVPFDKSWRQQPKKNLSQRDSNILQLRRSWTTMRCTHPVILWFFLFFSGFYETCSFHLHYGRFLPVLTGFGARGLSAADCRALFLGTSSMGGWRLSFGAAKDEMFLRLLDVCSSCILLQ